jgi:cephalosporin hydroxylase
MDILRALRHTTIFGQHATQYWVDVVLWEHFFWEHKINGLVELGTGAAGMSLAFALHGIQRGFEFYTFDIKKWDKYSTPLTDMVGLSNHFQAVDVFGDGQQIILRLIERAELHPLMLYCDNGDKRREVHTFAPALHRGDFLAVHDWPDEFGPEDASRLEQNSLVKPLYRDVAEQLGGLTRMWSVGA